MDLRRAVSAAYYSVFHLLIHEAVEWSLGQAAADLKSKAARSFEHKQMKNVCATFAQQNLPPKVQLLLGQPVSADLVALAKALIKLQELRQAADYEWTGAWSKAGALAAYDLLDIAVGAVERLQGSSDYEVFLTALIYGRIWERD